MGPLGQLLGVPRLDAGVVAVPLRRSVLTEAAMGVAGLAVRTDIFRAAKLAVADRTAAVAGWDA